MSFNTQTIHTVIDSSSQLFACMLELWTDSTLTMATDNRGHC